jgi:hypothetical protein
MRSKVQAANLAVLGIAKTDFCSINLTRFSGSYSRVINLREEARLRLAMSRDQLTAKFGVSLGTLKKWENNGVASKQLTFA